MAIIFNATRVKNRSASYQSQQNTYDLTYIVEATAKEGPLQVRNYVLTQLGGLGSSYVWQLESDPYSYLNEIDVRESSSDGATYDVSVRYTPIQLGDGNPFDGTLREVEYDWQTYEIEPTHDILNTPILNSAGDPYPERVTKEITMPIIKVSRYEPTLPAYTIFQNRDSVNNGTWNGYPSGTVRIRAPKIHETMTVSGVAYKYDYEFMINPFGWNSTVLDAGFNQVVSGVRQKIYVDGQPINEALPLNGSGKVLPPSGLLRHQTYDIYQTIDFSGWNITL